MILELLHKKLPYVAVANVNPFFLILSLQNGYSLSNIHVMEPKIQNNFSLQLGLATVWALGDYSLKLF